MPSGGSVGLALGDGETSRVGDACGPSASGVVGDALGRDGLGVAAALRVFPSGTDAATTSSPAMSTPASRVAILRRAGTTPPQLPPDDMPIDQSSSAGPTWAQLLVPPLSALSFGAAAIHFALTAEHFTEFWLYGLFFAAIAWFQVLWPLAYLRWPTPAAAGMGFAVNAATVLLWAWTRFVGLPLGPNAGELEAVGLEDLAAATFEVLLCSALVLLLVPRFRTHLRRTRASVAGLAGSAFWVVAVAVATTVVLAWHGNDIMVMSP